MQFTEIPKRVGLPELESLVLKSQLSKMEKARDAAVLRFDDCLSKVEALEPRVYILRVELGLLKRLESTNCNLKVCTCKVADAQGGTGSLVGGCASLL